jgi:hypothetical protein
VAEVDDSAICSKILQQPWEKLVNHHVVEKVAPAVGTSISQPPVYRDV